MKKIYFQDDIHFYVALEGSPKNCGFKSQKDFIDRISHYEIEEMTLRQTSVAQCEMLITDNTKSTSSKMMWMKQKWGAEVDEHITTYEDVLELFGEHFRKDKIIKLMKKLKNEKD